MNDFRPYTPQLGIAGSSYQLQMGKINNYWTIRLVKGRDVLASKIFKDVPNPEEIPLGNQITGWILSVLAIPNLNTYQIQKTVGFIRQKALRTQEEQEKMRQSAGKSESMEKVLEKIPDDVQIKRPQARGWVKEDNQTQEVISEEIAELSPGLVQQNEDLSGHSTGSLAHIRSKSLHKIPMGEGFVPKPFKYHKKINSKSISNKILVDQNTFSDIEQIKARISALEKRVEKLEYENAELRAKLG